MKNKKVIIGVAVGLVIATGFYLYVNKKGLGKAIPPKAQYMKSAKQVGSVVVLVAIVFGAAYAAGFVSINGKDVHGNKE